MKFSLNLLEVPYSKVGPIIDWCFFNNIQQLKCIEILRALYEPQYSIESWEIEFEEAEAVLFLLRWGGETSACTDS